MRLTQTQIREAGRNQYGDLNVDFAVVLKSIYPDVEVKESTPGCWGHSGEITLRGNVLSVPAGKYESNKHFHTAGHAIRGIESARHKLNIKPLLLLKGYGYNGDYKSLKTCFYIFGENEDSSFFLHKVRPKVGALGDFEAIRRWLWSLKPGEEVAARQGDLGFIPSKRPRTGEEFRTVEIGSHAIKAHRVVVKKLKHGERYFARDPVAHHLEHATIELAGWYEMRPAKAWRSSAD